MQRTYQHFKDEPLTQGQQTSHKALLDWHKSLYDHKDERAGLRRCSSVDDVFLTSGFRSLYQSGFFNIKPDSTRFLALACAAGVLSHVKDDLKNPAIGFAQQMASPKQQNGPASPNGQPAVSQLRLSKLQKSYSWDEFYRGLIRTVKLLGGTVNIVALTDAIFHWGKEFDGNFDRQPMNRLQVRWAAEYYGQLTNPSSSKDSKNKE